MSRSSTKASAKLSICLRHRRKEYSASKEMQYYYYMIVHSWWHKNLGGTKYWKECPQQSTGPSLLNLAFVTHKPHHLVMGRIRFVTREH